jgi:two-component system, sensor histidine kinase YesM
LAPPLRASRPRRVFLDRIGQRPQNRRHEKTDPGRTGGRMSGGLLERRIGRRFFDRVIFASLLVQIVLFLLIAIPMIQTIFSTLRERDLYLNRQIVQSIVAEFSRTFVAATQFNRELYEDPVSLDEIVYLMENGLERYNSYRLDRYASAKEFTIAHFTAGLFTFLTKNPQVQQVVLYSTVQDFALRFESKVIKLIDPGELSPVLRSARLSPGSPFVPARSITTVSEETASVYGIRFPVYEGVSGRQVGLLIVDVLTSSLADRQFSRYLRGDFVITASGVPLVSSTGAIPEWALGVRAAQAAGQLSSTPCPDLPECVLTQLVDPARIRSEQTPILTLLYLLVGAFIVTTILLLAVLTRLVNRRVRPIIEGMAELQSGNLAHRLPVPRRDELGLIAESFNRMAEDLAEHIQKTYVLRLAQQEAEMRRLEAQVNPHFLNNALEAIRMKALADGSPDAAEMIFHLARMFHAMSRQKPHFASLQSEVKLCREYLRICELRYGRCFTVSFDVPPGCAEADILTNLLQPVVENYIAHGLDKSRTDNALAVSAAAGEGVLAVRFRDNGRGIPEARLAAIRAVLADPESTSDAEGIGLANVHRRIRIAYGDGFGLALGPVDGGGTEVVLRVPLAARGAPRGG